MAERYEVDERGALIRIHGSGIRVMVGDPARARAMLDALREGEDRLPQPLSNEFADGDYGVRAFVDRGRTRVTFERSTFYGADCVERLIGWLTAHLDAESFGGRES